ncbi:hypothetical protein A374_15888 [Fictibacillus macauensis ZFHKF-1]|uniref:Uncharacterized protein n=1 Tax=Fictibacillus macauensis ZFHKF-1 TaxID=1196324 RepID=I8AF74_9BACL|nr:hypothetical protein [Fictibacillus macauensis]EIT84282.1 hypothetical protein A374_15888 [Fictibacillus macauensis ZFHKF-1]
MKRALIAGCAIILFIAFAIVTVSSSDATVKHRKHGAKIYQLREDWNKVGYTQVKRKSLPNEWEISVNKEYFSTKENAANTAHIKAFKRIVKDTESFDKFINIAGALGLLVGVMVLLYHKVLLRKISSIRLFSGVIILYFAALFVYGSYEVNDTGTKAEKIFTQVIKHS